MTISQTYFHQCANYNSEQILLQERLHKKYFFLEISIFSRHSDTPDFLYFTWYWPSGQWPVGTNTNEVRSVVLTPSILLFSYHSSISYFPIPLFPHKSFI